MSLENLVFRYVLEEGRKRSVPLCVWNGNFYDVKAVAIQSVHIVKINTGTRHPHFSPCQCFAFSYGILFRTSLCSVFYTFFELGGPLHPCADIGRPFPLTLAEQCLLRKSYPSLRNVFLSAMSDDHLLQTGRLTRCGEAFYARPWFPSHAIVATLQCLYIVFPRDLIWIIVNILCNITLEEDSQEDPLHKYSFALNIRQTESAYCPFADEYAPMNPWLSSQMQIITDDEKSRRHDNDE